MGWPTSTPPPSHTRPTPRRIGTASGQRRDGSGCSGPVCQRPPTSPWSRRTWAARSAASCSSGLLRTAERTRAAVARLASTGGAVSAAIRSATVASRSAASTTRLASPMRAPRRRSRPAGQADLERPRVPDELHQGAGPGQVGYEPERRLGQPECGVLGEDAQVARERELRAGTDGSGPAPPRSRRCRANAATGSRPGTPDPLLRLVGGQPADVAEPALDPGSGSNRLRSRPAEKARPAPRTTTTRTSSGRERPTRPTPPTSPASGHSGGRDGPG